jgi:hypothetical protein
VYNQLLPKIGRVARMSLTRALGMRCPALKALNGPSNIRFASAASAIQRNSDPEAKFVVTGANRGIGYEFTSQLLQRTQGR